MEIDLLIDFVAVVGVDLGDKAVATGIEVEERLGTHGLGDLNSGLGTGVFMGIVDGGGIGDILGSYAEDDGLAEEGSSGIGETVVEADVNGTVLPVILGKPDGPIYLGHITVEKIHGRGADETGDEHIVGFVVEIEGFIDLQNVPLFHDADTIAHGHGLDLVVGDINHGGPEAGMELADLGPHGDAHFGVEVGKGFIEEKDLGIADDGATDGDALALTTGEGLGLAVEKFFDAEDGGGLLHAAGNFLLGLFLKFEAEGHIIEDGHVWVEGVVLKDHGDITILWLDLIDDATGDGDGAAGDFLEAGDHAQRSGFAATGRPDQDHEFAVTDIEVDFLNCFERGIFAGGRIDLEEILDNNFCHDALRIAACAGEIKPHFAE